MSSTRSSAATSSASRSNASTGYRPDLAQLEALIASGPDLVILVNPNSPTGQFITAAEIESCSSAAPPSTRLWIDETYVDYVGETVEPPDAAARQPDRLQVDVEGVRARAVPGSPISPPGRTSWRTCAVLTPPWVIGLPSQVAATRAP